MIGYTIVGARRDRDDLVTVQFVTDNLQWMHITVPYAHSSADELDTAIQAAVAGVYRPPKPIGVPANGR